jgi:DNA/RNA-binding domain of Phe-tRNA-synthetase-like protein
MTTPQITPIDVSNTLPFVTVHAWNLEPITVTPAPDGFNEAAAERIAQWRETYHQDTLADIPEIAALRAMVKAGGLDPSRYRPSAEALLRRILKGQDLYRINNVVDAVNILSVQYLLPICAHTHHNGAYSVRLGTAGESYAGIMGKREQLENRILLCDSEGPCGNPHADSARTKVTPRSTSIAIIAYCPGECPDGLVTDLATILGAEFAKPKPY